MANTTISPNMNMPVPTVSLDPGPDWASNIDACLSIVDSHTHTAGQGVLITPDAINITSDLPMNGNNLTSARSVRFSAQSAPLALAADLGCVYVSGVDLYYNDEVGNQVRITQSGSVTGSTGTITGLPSGTASASYAAGTFTFQSATNTPATMNVGTVQIGQEVALGKKVVIAANVSQASDYNLTLPLALPAASAIFATDNAGNMSLGTAINSGTLASTFTFNGTGSPGTSGSVTMRFQLIGSYITIYVPIVTATTGVNSTALSSNSTLPSWACPLSTNANARGPTDILSNGVSTTSPGLLIVSPSGNVFILRDNVQTTFANAANGGSALSFTATYFVGTGS